MNYGFKSVWKEGVVAYFKELPQYLPERAEEKLQNMRRLLWKVVGMFVTFVQGIQYVCSNFMEQITLLITCCHFAGNPMVH